MLLAVVAVIAGILGMHALSVSHHAAASHASADTHQPVHAAPKLDQATVTVAALPAPSTAVNQCGPGCPDGAGSTTCVAVLTLLMLLRRPRAHHSTTPPRDRRGVQLLVLWARRPLPRPPSLAALGVLRI